MDEVTAIEEPGVRDHVEARRGQLAMFLVPMGLVFAAAQVGRAIWPSLLNTAPWALLMMSSTWTRLLVVQPLVPTVVFFALAIGRPMLLAPLYYFFGRRYGDVALRWGERKLGPSSTFVAKAEHYFGRFSYLLVALWWSVIICVMAGATGMKARAFFPLLLVGTTARVTALYFLGDAFAGPITDFTQFVGRYALFLTPITIAITALQLRHARRKQRGIPIETIEEFEAQLDDAAAELASEATVTSPREPD